VHVQKPSVHWPLARHVPSTHAWPPPHWLLAVHATHAPSTHASSVASPRSNSLGTDKQSAYVWHAVHTLFTHACPSAQSPTDWHAPHSPNGCRQPCPGWHWLALVHEQAPLHDPLGPHWSLDVHAPQTPSTQACPSAHEELDAHAGVQMPEAQASPLAQSPFTLHVHWTDEWVAVHVADGPHCASLEQLPHTPPLHTSPAGQPLLVEHEVSPPPLPLPLPLPSYGHPDAGHGSHAV
jgi:hypothetical protein